MSTLTTLLGGEALAVEYRDLSAAPPTAPKQVFVRALPLRLIARWSELDSNGSPEAESSLIELYCGMEEGFADLLAPQSCEAILAKGDALNRPIFARWQKRHSDRAHAWVAAGEQMKALVADLPAPSPTPQPNSAPSSGDSQPR